MIPNLQKFLLQKEFQIESLVLVQLVVIEVDINKVEEEEKEDNQKKDLLIQQVEQLFLQILLLMKDLITFWLLKMLHKAHVHQQDIMLFMILQDYRKMSSGN